ncbi:DUF2332 domain-containing protein [Rhodococcus aerolatus]
MGPLLDALREQAPLCLPSSPLTHRLLLDAAADLQAGGDVAVVLAGHEHDRLADAPGLRLAGALHRLALLRRAPGYALHLPSCGGTPDLDRLWPAAADALAEHRDTVRAWVDATAVQTNEAGRLGPLWGGLQVASQQAGLPVRLLEVGASGGLNLRPDRVGLDTPAGLLGDATSPLRVTAAWTGLPPAELDRPLAVVARAGGDVDPVDPGSTAGRAHLGSFVWPDDRVRWERLRAALALAAAEPVVVRRASAAAFLAEELAAPAPGVLTVVWHSVVRQYVDRAERARAREVLAGAAARADARAPLAHLSYEPVRVVLPDGTPGHRFELRLRTWPGDGAVRVLGHGGGHGTPFRWTAWS